MAVSRMDLKRQRLLYGGANDLLSNLAEDSIINILSFLPVHDAARTSLLSSRFRDLWKQVSVLRFSTRDITSDTYTDTGTVLFPKKSRPEASTIFVPIYKAIINHDPSVPLVSLHLHCDLIWSLDAFYYASHVISSLLHAACTLGLRHLTVDFSSNWLQALLPIIFSLPSLESLSLPSPMVYVMSSMSIRKKKIALPCLKSLSLSLKYFHSCFKHNKLFSKLTSLEDLHLQVNCSGSFSLSSQSIRHLNLKVHTRDGVTLNLPALESLRLETARPCKSIPLFEANLPSLKKCVISLNELYVGDASTVVEMLCCLSHAEELHLVLTECLIRKMPYHVLLDPDKDFPIFLNLKYLEITACFHELNCKAVITLLHNSPALRSLKLFHKAVEYDTKDTAVKICWRSKLPRNRKGNSRYGYFTNLHLEDKKEKLLKLLNKRLST